MSSTGKRLDLRFGAFACSVQGFDDPVPPVQQILRAIQHLLEESPELADTAISFDAEAIEQLIGEVARRSELEESQVEIVPGLVIIHHGAGGDLAADGAWSAGARDEDLHAARDEGGGDYVNIFAAGGGDEDAREEAEAGAGGAAAEKGGEEEDFADRLRRMAEGGDEYGWGEDDAEEETQPREPAATAPTAEAEESDEDEEEPLNLFAPATAGEEEREAGEEPEKDAGASVRNLFATGEQDEDWQPSPAGSWREAEPQAAAPGESEEEPSEGLDAADFAKRAGAESVPELMIASAAWMVLVQGQTSFTRRDVLDVFETIPGEHDNTPEARIKGFGKAVRNGQLVMTGDGIFGLARSEVERFQDLL